MNGRLSRNILLLIIVSIVIFSFTGCGSNKYVFQAFVTDIVDKNMTVIPVEGSDELRSSDCIVVPMVNMGASPEIQAGDIIEIEYNGEILESYPASLGEVYRITVVKQSFPTESRWYISHVYGDGEEVMLSEAINSKYMADSSIRHLPVYIINSMEELHIFANKYHDILTMDFQVEGFDSFEQTCQRFDDKFFEDNSLILTYIAAPSGSLRFQMKDMSVDGETLRMSVTETPDSVYCTEEVAGWIISAELSDSDIDWITDYDAVFVEK